MVKWHSVVSLWVDSFVLTSVRETGTLQGWASRRSLKSGVQWLVASLSGSQLDRNGGPKRWYGDCGSSGKYSVAPELGVAWLAVGR